MPFRFRLILACLLVAGAAATSASAADHMWMGFQDDPALRWRQGRTATFNRLQQFNTSVVRTTVYWSRIAPTPPGEPVEPVRPRLPLRRPRRVRPQRGDARHRGHADDLGHAELGERRQGPELAPTRRPTGSGLSRARVAIALQRHATAGFPSVQLLRRLERAQPRSCSSTPQYNSKGKPVSPFIYGRLYRAAYAGIKAGNPAAHVGIGETVSARPRQPRRARQARRRPWRRRRSRGCSRRLGRACSSTPGRTTRTRPSATGPMQRMRYPNVELTHAAVVRGASEQVVQARVDADLGHRIRLPDEAGRAAGRDAGAARRRTCGRRWRWSGACPTCRCSSGSSSATTRRAPGRAAS